MNKAPSSQGSPGLGPPAPEPRRPPGATAHPLGPVLYRVPHRVRARAAWVLVGGVVVLGTAAWLSPDPSGVGTHRQLGFPPCGLMVTTGTPCPTCGMTTAFSHVIRGRLGTAMVTQPFGALLALGAIAATGLASAALLTGRAWWVNWYRVSPGWVIALIVVLFLAAWAYKIAAVRLAG